MGDIMTCKINADTTDGLKLISDTSGAVDIQSNGTTKVTVDANGNINTVGQVSTTDNGTIVTRQNAKPIIYNGDMQITQRATSKTGITSTTLEVQDRWSVVMGGAGTWTQSSDTDVPTGQGFTKSMKWDCTTARSLVAGSIFYIRQTLEGQDLQLLKYGTSNAEKLTLSFWLKSPKAGTHIAQLYGADDNRSVSKAYTVSSANTWQKVVLDFPADTTGVIDNDNGYGMGVQLWFLAGTTYSSGTLNTTWNTYANADAAVGQVDCADSTSNNIFLTGVQLEVGEYDSTTLPAFQHESFGDNLTRCKRYYQQSYTSGTSAGTVTNDGAYMVYLSATGNTFRYNLNFETEMRAIPTKVFYVPSTGTVAKAGYEGAGDTNAFTVNTTFNTNKHALLFQTSVPATGYAYWQWIASAEI